MWQQALQAARLAFRRQPARYSSFADDCRHAMQGGKGAAGRAERDIMRTKVLEDAAIVCSTLSFSGSGAFGQMARAFDVVIIDEAAQAVEPSILIPLTAGCKQVIMCHDQLTNLRDARGANALHVSARLICGFSQWYGVAWLPSMLSQRGGQARVVWPIMVPVMCPEARCSTGAAESLNEVGGSSSAELTRELWRCRCTWWVTPRSCQRP